MILYLSDPKNSTRELLQVVNNFSKVSGYKIKSSKPVIFLYPKDQQAEKEIREMQIKTTLRFHLIPVRMAKIKNSGDSRCWQGCGERGILLHCWWVCKLALPLWKSVWQLLGKWEWYFQRTQLYHSWAYIQRILQHVIRINNLLYS